MFAFLPYFLLKYSGNHSCQYFLLVFFTVSGYFLVSCEWGGEEGCSDSVQGKVCVCESALSERDVCCLAPQSIHVWLKQPQLPHLETHDWQPPAYSNYTHRYSQKLLKRQSTPCQTPMTPYNHEQHQRNFTKHISNHTGHTRNRLAMP